ncbi:MAG: two-component sensor histidine kinase [Alphaproteobacteria bacterium]|nr:two-component sensor histidine kinase [Alphaproteobacteria bacterium]
MAAAGDAGAGRGGGWLQRFLGTRAEVSAPAPAAAPVQGPADYPLLEAAISVMPDPVAVLDRDGRVVVFNTGAAALAPALRRGEPASLALRMPELVEAIRSAGATGKPQRIEFSLRVPSARWFEAFVAPVTPSGRDGIVVMTVHDLTPIHRVEEMRADFVANVSHELRTPLAAITGFIDTLQGPARDDPAARERFLGIMQQQSWRMARLIDDLLSLSRIELRAHQRPETPIDVAAIVRQVVDGLQVLSRDRGVAIELAAPPEPLIVLGDRDELIRLFENLVENALKYGASGKCVDIALSRVPTPDGKGEAQVSVRDYGPGIAAEHLPRLTERFYRVDVGESRAQGGTGLGLALVKHILNRHQGRLNIESRPGQGATFIARLPLV